MPIPTPPTILLAAAGLAMVSGRFLPARFSVIWGWYFFLSLVAAAVSLWFDPMTTSADVAAFDLDRVWTNDALAISEQWLVLLFGLLLGVALVDAPFRNHNRLTSLAFLLFTVAGLMLVARANDLLSMGMSLEIVSLSVIAFRTSALFLPDSASRAARTEDFTDNEEGRFFSPRWLDWLASGWMWFGIAILSTTFLTTQFDAIRVVLVDAYRPDELPRAIGSPSKLVLLAAGLITMSLLGRMGLAPFQFGVHWGSQGRFVIPHGFAILAGQLAGSIALCRLCGRVFAGLGNSLVVLMTVVSLASFFLTAVMAVRGFSPGIRSIPRWLTSLVLLQSAWLSVGLLSASMELDHPEARWGAFPGQNETLSVIVFSQFAGLLTLGGLFGILGHLTRTDRGIEFLEDVKGLSQFALPVALALIVCLAGVIGGPWTAGFWGRWLTLLTAHNIHVKSTSSIFLPHGGVRLVLLAGTISTLFVGRVVIRIAREMFIEAPLARPSADGGRGPLIVGLVAAAATLLLGVAPQSLLIPFRAINAPRELQPENPPQGSGKNHSAHRSRVARPDDFYGSPCQASYARQVRHHFLISTKLAGCPWQSSNGWAQFCPVWSGTSSPD